MDWFLATELIRNVKHSYHSSSFIQKVGLPSWRSGFLIGESPHRGPKPFSADLPGACSHLKHKNPEPSALGLL